MKVYQSLLASGRSGTLKASPEHNKISRGLLLEELKILKASYGICHIPCLLVVFELGIVFNIIFAII